MSEAEETQGGGDPEISSGEAAENPASIGRTLHATRRRRRISMDRAAAETRIRRDYLMAMEKDDFSFQAPIYVKGLLANYARFLRLEPHPLLEKLERRAVSGTDGATALAEKNAAWTAALRASSTTRPIVLTTCALLILTALALWNKANARSERPPERGSIEASEG